MIVPITFVLLTSMVAIGSWLKVKKNTEKEDANSYFLAGRGLSGIIIASSLILTNLSTEQLIGLNAQSYTANMTPMAWEVCAALTLVLVALYLLPRYLSGGFSTIPDFIEDRYGKSTMYLCTFLFLFGYIFNLLPPILYTGSVALSGIFNVPEVLEISYWGSLWVMVFALGFIGVSYAVFGGLKAITYADTFNGVGLLIGGVILIPFFGLAALGHGSALDGFQVLMTEHPEKLNAIGGDDDPVPISTFFTGMLILNLFYWGTNQSIIQRALGAKNLAEGQKGVLWAGLVKLAGPFYLLLPGVIAFALFGDSLQSGEAAYPALVREVLPAPMLGFFAAVLFGAVLSSFNNVLHSTSTLFTLNVYKPLINPEASDTKLVKVGRRFSGIIGFGSIFVAPFIYYAPQGFFQYFQTINSFYMAPMCTIIVVGFITRRVPTMAANIGVAFFMISYILSMFVFKFDIHFLHLTGVLFVATAILMLIIGALFPSASEYQPKLANVVQLEHWKFAKPMAAIICVGVVILYVVFSPLGIAK
ncbi:solute:sodium symporter family transporter [Vibrio sp. 10N.286.49.C2]|uniref:solute:sodium symporter family transporter n=1 Tax=unclassified Vibrio TaxID=2614977 RepID=UPI000C846EBE|nr:MULTISPECIES: solute:sodium symporter family transporter [unclassified Vibrio]PMH26427.1 solute:sodium symporter family transporter [Vibrio sp. 10N.286.49.C2]PMH54849.1 solute:sodium symporter family transporter [Vibrio sp. 10N.286.49.B1]PMH84087.1 solute:sodium symporter family transporter [Vibrio sp. 10N.286.48.B7]